MKKLMAIFLTLVFILALTACGATEGSGEAVAGGESSNMPNTDTSIMETEQSQLADTEAVSGTVSRVGTEETYELTAEETATISDILNNGNWIDDLTKCESDCVIATAEGDLFYYHSDCGTWNDNLNNRCLTVTDIEKEDINAILSQYITLGL